MMSKIRCLNNPEGLYIWDDGEFVSVAHCIKPPLTNMGDIDNELLDEDTTMLIPSAVFNAVMEECWNHSVSLGCFVEKDGFKVEEIEINSVTGQVHGENGYYWDPMAGCDLPENKHKELCQQHIEQIRWTYNGKFICMWG